MKDYAFPMDPVVTGMVMNERNASPLSLIEPEPLQDVTSKDRVIFCGPHLNTAENVLYLASWLHRVGEKTRRYALYDLRVSPHLPAEVISNLGVIVSFAEFVVADDESMKVLRGWGLSKDFAEALQVTTEAPPAKARRGGRRKK